MNLWNTWYRKVFSKGLQPNPAGGLRILNR